MHEQGSETARTPDPRTSDDRSLTTVQVVVLRMLADGQPAVAAAEATRTSLHSVARTTTWLRAHYGVESTAEALDHARRAGLI